jgi:hypothetical protein
MSSLAEALPAEIKRVRRVQDEFKALRGMRNVIVEPQIAMMERSIEEAIKASASGDVVAMLRAFEDLKGLQA